MAKHKSGKAGAIEVICQKCARWGEAVKDKETGVVTHYIHARRTGTKICRMKEPTEKQKVTLDKELIL